MGAATEYVLLAQVFHLRQQSGRVRKFREGDIVTGLSEEQERRLLRIGAIVERGEFEARAATADVAGVDVEETGEPTPAEPTVPGPDGPEPEEPAAAKPGPDAPRPELIDWLIDNAVDENGNDYTKSKLSRLKKDQLRELVDQVED